MVTVANQPRYSMEYFEETKSAIIVKFEHTKDANMSHNPGHVYDITLGGEEDQNVPVSTLRNPDMLELIFTLLDPSSLKMVRLVCR